MLLGIVVIEYAWLGRMYCGWGEGGSCVGVWGGGQGIGEVLVVMWCGGCGGVVMVWDKYF